MSTVEVAASAFVALLPLTNPLGAVAAFAGLTDSQSPAEVRRQGMMTGVYVAAILATFALLGTVILHAFGITIPALQIAGGLVVAHSAFTMIVPRQTLTAAEASHSSAKADVSFSPMALPLVDRLGPSGIGAIARVMGFLILAIGVELVTHGVRAAGVS